MADHLREKYDGGSGSLLRRLGPQALKTLADTVVVATGFASDGDPDKLEVILARTSHAKRKEIVDSWQASLRGAPSAQDELPPIPGPTRSPAMLEVLDMLEVLPKRPSAALNLYMLIGELSGGDRSALKSAILKATGEDASEYRHRVVPFKRPGDERMQMVEILGEVSPAKRADILLWWDAYRW